MNKIIVSRKDDYHCVVATRRILKGEIILKLQGIISSSPDKYSVQISEREHLLPFSENPLDESSSFRFLNHNCSPNSYFDMENKILIALKDIHANEEINFHYCTTEYEMASPFKCLCKSINCLTEIKGYRYLSPEKKNELFSQLASPLKITEELYFEHRKK